MHVTLSCIGSGLSTPQSARTRMGNSLCILASVKVPQGNCAAQELGSSALRKLGPSLVALAERKSDTISDIGSKFANTTNFRLASDYGGLNSIRPHDHGSIKSMVWLDSEPRSGPRECALNHNVDHEFERASV